MRVSSYRNHPLDSKCTNRFFALIQNQMRGQDASTTSVASKYNLG